MPPILRGRGGPLRPRPVFAPSIVQNTSPIYERGRTVTESTLKAQTARTARDRVLEVLSDERFHSAFELEHLNGLKVGDWVVAVRELIEYGYAFGRRSNSLIMRRRSLAEKPQDLADLLAQIDARSPEDLNPQAPSAAHAAPPARKPRPAPEPLATEEDNGDGEGDQPQPFDATSDAVMVAEGDKMVLSADEGAFVVDRKSVV